MQSKPRHPDAGEGAADAQTPTHDSAPPAARTAEPPPLCAQNDPREAESIDALRASEERLTQAVAVARLGFFDHDHLSGRLHWSPTMRRIHDWPEDRPPNLDEVTRTVHPDDRDAFVSAVRAAHSPRGSGEFAIEYRIIRRDGSVRWIGARSQTFFAGEHAARRAVRTIGAEIDITDSKHAEEALRHANEHLERRVEERTADLARSVETLRAEVARRTQVEQALRQRTDQLRALASQLTLTEQRERLRLAEVLHDGLQQILVAIKFRLELLDRAGERDRRHLSDQLDDMVSDALETSRSLTAELSPPVLRGGGLIPALEWLVRWMGEKHGLTVRFHVSSHPGAIGEDVTVLFFQAARELLFNVVKHGRTESASMEVGMEGKLLCLAVADEGAGFDPGQLADRQRPMGGLGLFSIHERITLLGGHLAVESAPGRGSRFTLTIPLAPAAATTPAGEAPRVPLAAAQAGPEGQPATGKLRIVLVDDHVVMRQGLAGILGEESDIEIVGEASDGRSAVELARLLRPDVVLMDINMPVMNGIDATRIIHSEMPDVRVIGLSMFEDAERARAMREAGACQYISKSGASAALLETIRACRREPGAAPC